jgi:hypothetical protein
VDRYADANAVANAIGCAQHFSRSHHAVIRVYDEAGNVIETHEHTMRFQRVMSGARQTAATLAKHDG